jgi:hypothetical protein
LQAWIALALALDQKPAGASLQASLSVDAANVPAAQIVGRDEPAGQNEPAGHLCLQMKESDWSVALEYRPALHTPEWEMLLSKLSDEARGVVWCIPEQNGVIEPRPELKRASHALTVRPMAYLYCGARLPMVNGGTAMVPEPPGTRHAVDPSKRTPLSTQLSASRGLSEESSQPQGKPLGGAERGAHHCELPLQVSCLNLRPKLEGE